MSISSPGIGSNLDVNSIISQLMAVESKPLTILAKKEASYQSKLSAYGSLSGALSSFQVAINGLNNLSKFQQISTTTTDATIASATAGSAAVPGKYDIDVTQRAQAQSISAGGQANTTSAIGAGTATTLTFQFGTITGGTLTDGVYDAATFEQDAAQSTGSITIDSSNNSLQGIRDAINKAAIGVTATIVSDGSTAPNRLVLTSSKTGATSSMKISVAGDTALQDLLTYNPAGTQKLTQNAVGQDALLKVNGIDIKSATNTISGAIDNLTLTLSKIGNTSIAVTRDTAAIETSVNTFVKSYNELQGTIKNLTAYNPTTKIGGPLLGDATTRSIEAELRRTFSTQPEGLTEGLVNLTQIGLTFQKDGTLGLDSSKLKAAIASNPADIGKLFATAGTPTDSLVSFVSSSSSTKPGNNTLVISALASKGKITGSAVANTTIAAGVNDGLSLTIDGVTSTIKLAAGIYTADSLSVQLQSLINGVSAFSAAGVSVSVTQSGGILNVTSNRYGSASKVAITGNGAADLLGAAPTTTDGIDVAGTINGIAAAGAGQLLTGAASSSAEGLKILIAGGALGARGNVNFSQGYASQLNRTISAMLGTSGTISGRTDGINRSIKDIGTQREAMNTRLANTEERYLKQFTALDVMISNMKSTSTYLTQQLDAIANNNN